MAVLYVVTGCLVVLSLLANARKTGRALEVAVGRFFRIAPGFLAMLVLVAFFLYVIPDELLVRVLTGEGRWVGIASAVAVGSISVMPGFIAFPLCGILREQGALFMVIAAFSTTVMMVGVATFPLERSYLGTPLALARNVVSLAIALIVALATGLLLGELS